MSYSQFKPLVLLSQYGTRGWYRSRPPGPEERPELPVIGNGDILTWYEARDRMERSGAHAAMVGRGALIKPWIFKEVKEGKEWEPTVAERVEVYARLTRYMKEHFGDDDIGLKRFMIFMPWHLGFFCR